MKIWILTRIVNDYNQPDNDLVAWWPEKPSHVKLGIALNVYASSEHVKQLHSVGYVRDDFYTSWQLREISPGFLENK